MTRRRAIPLHLVRAMRASTESNSWWLQELEQNHGIKVSRNCVRTIRTGQVYKNLLGDADTIDGKNCGRCQHWRGEQAVNPCDLGHPDPLIEGLKFAQDCATYQEGSAKLPAVEVRA